MVPGQAGLAAAPSPLAALLQAVRACDLCAAHLPQAPRPVLQCHAEARILIAGQAPGSKVQRSGVPFLDASGDRLRGWLGVSRQDFHDERRIAILPMGFCYPGRGGAGDLPPRSECAAAWRRRLLAHLTRLQLTLVVGRYALAWHLADAGRSVTAAVRDWPRHWPALVPLPHPSPRNNRWLKQNPWFEAELLPRLRERVAQVLA